MCTFSKNVHIEVPSADKVLLHLSQQYIYVDTFEKGGKKRMSRAVTPRKILFQDQAPGRLCVPLNIFISIQYRDSSVQRKLGTRCVVRSSSPTAVDILFLSIFFILLQKKNHH